MKETQEEAGGRGCPRHARPWQRVSRKGRSGSHDDKRHSCAVRSGWLKKLQVDASITMAPFLPSHSCLQAVVYHPPSHAAISAPSQGQLKHAEQGAEG